MMTMSNRKIVTALFLSSLLAGIATVSVVDASVCEPKSGSCDECTRNLVSSATKDDGTVYCSDEKNIQTGDMGVEFTGGDVLWYQNIRKCGSPCFDDDSEDDSEDEDDEDESYDDGDEEGSDVCYADTCCPDSLSTVEGTTDNSKGLTYCVKYQAEEVVEGIFYTYPDGKSNTKWWKNIYPCEPNRRGLCHYDESDDGPLDKVEIADDGSTKGNANNACYPLDGGSTTCKDPTHPVQMTCTPGVSKDLPSQFPGCCPNEGIYVGVIPGMTCSPSDAAGASGKACYPLSSGTKCYDGKNTQKSTCQHSDGKVQAGCCPPGVTKTVVPGMKCVPSSSKDVGSSNLCYPYSDGQKTCFDPSHPILSTCNVAGETKQGCCPDGVTNGVVPGMTCSPSDSKGASSTSTPTDESSTSAPTDEESDEKIHSSHDHASDDLATVDELACGNKDFTTLCTLIESCPLDNWELPVTVFAPTDDAFKDLDEAVGGLENLSDALLCSVFEFHIVNGNYIDAEELKFYCESGDASLIEMYNGLDNRVKCYKGVPYGIKGGGNDHPANIVSLDIKAANGIIHVIDQVLLYPRADIPSDISVSLRGAESPLP